MPGKGKTNGRRAFTDRSPIYDTTLVAAETHRAFEKLHEELYEEYSPVGITEEHLVQRLAFLFLERDRLFRYLQFQMEDRQNELKRQFPAAQATKRFKSQAHEAQQAKFLKEAQQYLDEVEGITTGKPKQIPPEKYRSPDELFDKIAALPDRPSNGRELFSKLVEEFSILERHEQFERIDVTIDRTIKRLMQLKTMKQMHRQLEPKVIAPSQNKKSSAASGVVDNN
jgi:hypothetical protein